MSTTTEVRVTVDQTLADEASSVYASMGVSLPDAIREFLIRSVAERMLPIDWMSPNAATREAMEEARRGELIRVGSVDDLFADLHSDE